MIYVFNEKLFVENYGDSVKIRLPGTMYNCNDVLQLSVVYGSKKEINDRKNLISDEFKIIDYVTNKECLAAYRKWTPISLPDASDDSKSKGKQGIFDLSGRRLSSPPSKGIYIHNGKKVIATGSH